METYAEIFLQYLLDGLAHPSDRVCDAAVNGLEVVVVKFGPLLSARLIVRPVLRQLSRDKGRYAAHVLGHLSAELGTFLLWKMYIPYLQAQVRGCFWGHAFVQGPFTDALSGKTIV